ncbi:MAG: DUF4396 domain-containing protein [Patulibacter sp.]|nr:DUF4396 domain-containing protein [Patulibacter sp.]
MDHAAPTPSDLNRMGVQATLHCMTGCAIGEIVGMAVATALGWGNTTSAIFATALAFFAGYALTSVPLFKAGLALAAVIPLALATDTVSITVMEIADNLTQIVFPGAMDATLGEALFWGPMLLGFVVAFPFAFVTNRWLLARGKGHALVHEYHHGHGDHAAHGGQGHAHDDHDHAAHGHAHDHA